jgi:hypothetical protein
MCLKCAAEAVLVTFISGFDFSRQVSTKPKVRANNVGWIEDPKALFSPLSFGYRNFDRSRLPVSLRGIRNAGNIRAAIGEIDRYYMGPDGLSMCGYINPKKYAHLNPNICSALDFMDPIQTIQNQIFFREEPGPVAQIRIKGRDIELSTAADRIVQRAVTRKLGPVLDPLFCESSWGFRPGRSPELAIQEVRSAIRKGFHWAFKSDIQHFFPSVLRKLLYSMLPHWVEDEELRSYLPVVITAGGYYPVKGLPQGNGLSPLLANLYLHPLDTFCSGLPYYRYADDLLILGRSSDDVRGAAAGIKFFLQLMGLQLNEGEKTVICNLHQVPISFLG